MDWIRLEIPTNRPSTSPGDGKFLVSSYDVPEAVRGSWTPDKTHFVIEFRYIGSEPKKLVTCTPKVRLQVGENSERIYGAEMDVTPGVTRETLKDLIETLIAQLPTNRTDNSAMVKEALASQAEALEQTAIEAIEAV